MSLSAETRALVTLMISSERNSRGCTGKGRVQGLFSLIDSDVVHVSLSGSAVTKEKKNKNPAGMTSAPQ